TVLRDVVVGPGYATGIRVGATGVLGCDLQLTSSTIRGVHDAVRAAGCDAARAGMALQVLRSTFAGIAGTAIAGGACLLDLTLHDSQFGGGGDGVALEAGPELVDLTGNDFRRLRSGVSVGRGAQVDRLADNRFDGIAGAAVLVDGGSVAGGRGNRFSANGVA